ncbi:MAG: isoleucine--tRNA ligase [Armatimonadetes bacterium]|nr:isoleucine--tRNA ligase [Armatimonadota bacterium]
MDYRETLNLLKTDFPMKANLPQREPGIAQWWEEIDIYRKVREKGLGRPKWVLHDGPPYANGNIHLGQALNKILKDIAIKYKTMRGFDCPYVPGWDTQGLPTEQAVRREMDVDRHDVSPVEWRRLCRDLALRYVDIQRGQFKRLGVRGDWEHPYLTLSSEYQARQIEAFGKIALKGLVNRRLRPVYWCHHPECVTALAEDEIEYHTKTSPSIYVAFELPGAAERFAMEQPLPEGARAEIVIWTTTPWTIPGNTGIALASSAEYVLVQAGHEGRTRFLVMAAELMDATVAGCGLADPKVVGRARGKDLEGLVAIHPLYGRDSQLVLADYVVLDQGSGCVHTAPGHGLEDFQTALKYGLDVISPLDDDGKYTDEAGPELVGKVCDQSNEIVMGMLTAKGALLAAGTLEHEYPHCWRCHEPVIYRATRQWFMDIDKLRDAALAEVQKCEWMPKWGLSRISGMIDARPDWCISRQRVWGVPIPVFYCADCDETIITRETLDHVRDLVAEHGADVWFERDAAELVPAGTVCPKCGAQSFTKEPDIMSVWFDSGASHYCVLSANDELGYPADLYLEGDDQYQCWFQTSLWVAVALGQPAPFKMVVGHAFFVDETGMKMSKSKGNIISPQDIYEKYGVDVLRLWFTYADFRRKMYCTEEIFNQVADAYRRIRNTARFMLANLQDFDPARDAVAPEEMREVDRWAIARLGQIVQRMTDAFDNWDLHLFYHDLHAYCATDLSAFYLDVLKDTLYVMRADSPERRSAQTALWHILIALAKMMAPVLTFTADELWQECRKLDASLPESVQLADWPEAEATQDTALLERWSRLLAIRDVALAALEKAKNEKVVEKPLEARVELYATADALEFLESFAPSLPNLFIVSAVSLNPAEGAPVPVDEHTGVSAVAVLSDGEKCQRCWLRSSTVGAIAQHPAICERCAANL